MAEDDGGRDRLRRWVIDFTEAFNREDLDEVMSYFADDAIYDEFDGTRNVGKAAIRDAFIPQFDGKFGRMRFHTEDMFLDVDGGKALIRWLCTMEESARQGGYRGLDILHFRDGKLVEKHTYAKTRLPAIRKKQEMLADRTWPDIGE